MAVRGTAVLLLLLLAASGCAAPPPAAPDLSGLPQLLVSSPAYEDGGRIPERFTCTGTDVSIPFEVESVPPGARYLAGLLEDPDATSGTWTHWTWWDLPANAIAAGEDADLAAHGAHEGTTTGGTVGYDGPCPRVGQHRYYLRIYATEEPLDLPEGASVKAFHAALRDKAVGQGSWMGVYAKP